MSHGVGLVTVVGGNVGSVRGALRRLGVEPRTVATPAELAGCSRVILPGVGAFATVMRRLRASGLDVALVDHARAGGSLLGICVGMQVLADTGDEGGPTAGLGLVPGHVRRLPDLGPPLPHIGWNQVVPRGSTVLFTDPAPRDFYFVHAWAMEPDDPADVAAVCEHGRPFVAAVARGPVLGVQFHPEKSQRDGLALLARFVRPPAGATPPATATATVGAAGPGA